MEPGQRWACLTKKEWTTKETLNLGSGTSFSLRGFQGDYEVLVKRDGVPVQRELFTLGKEGAVWNLDIIDSTGNVDSIPDCFRKCDQCLLHLYGHTSSASSRDEPYELHNGNYSVIICVCALVVCDFE